MHRAPTIGNACRDRSEDNHKTLREASELCSRHLGRSTASVVDCRARCLFLEMFSRWSTLKFATHVGNSS